MSDIKLVEESVKSMLSDVVYSVSVGSGVVMFPAEMTERFETDTGLKAPTSSVDVLVLEVQTLGSKETMRLFLTMTDASKVALAALEWVDNLHSLGKCGVDHD